MFLPIGDEPSDSTRPAWANYALIAANVLVYAGMRMRPGGEAAYEAAVHAWGYNPASPRLDALFSHMFMHAGLMHLVGNMLYLWVFGDNIEARLGSLGYLAAYLATGVVAGLAFAVPHGESAVPLVGASGAISGVQGMYWVACPRNRVKMLFWFYYIDVFYVPARWIIGFWFVWNDLVPVLVGAEGPVAHEAHLGGFGAGLLLALAFNPAVRRWLSERPAGPFGRRDPRAGVASPVWGGRIADARPVRPRAWGEPPPQGAPEEVILALWRAGRWGDAAQRYADCLRAGGGRGLPEAESIRLAVWLYDGGRFEDARLAFQTFLEEHAGSRHAPAAAFGLGMILARRDGDAVAARPHLEAVMRSHPDADVRGLARRELERLDAL